MNKPRIVLLVLALVLIVVGVALYFLLPSSPSEPVAPAGDITLPVAGLNTDPVSGAGTSISAARKTIILATAGGGTVEVYDFLQDTETVADTINQGYYSLGRSPQGVDATSTIGVSIRYNIVYIAATQYFNIELLQEPLGAVREEAQQYLLSHLGIREEQLCLLSYMVSVPYSVNSPFSSRSLGFSFCPGATTLPK